MDIKATVAKNLLFYRKQNKLSQKNLAEKIGVKHNTISAWESCTNSIDIDNLFKICDVLNVSINMMFGFDDVPATNQSSSYSRQEQKLIDDFRNLSRQGQEYILQTMDLAKNSYKKEETDNIVKQKKAVSQIA